MMERLSVALSLFFGSTPPKREELVRCDVLAGCLQHRPESHLRGSFAGAANAKPQPGQQTDKAAHTRSQRRCACLRLKPQTAAAEVQRETAGAAVGMVACEVSHARSLCAAVHHIPLDSDTRRDRSFVHPCIQAAACSLSKKPGVSWICSATALLSVMSKTQTK